MFWGVILIGMLFGAICGVLYTLGMYALHAIKNRRKTSEQSADTNPPNAAERSETKIFFKFEI